MICYLTDLDGTRLSVNATPECGEDFCERCGDCLRCFAGGDCYYNDGGEHLWIVEARLQPERAAGIMYG